MHCRRRKNKVHSVLLDKNVSPKIRNELKKQTASGVVSGLAKKAG